MGREIETVKVVLSFLLYWLIQFPTEQTSTSVKRHCGINGNKISTVNLKNVSINKLLLALNSDTIIRQVNTIFNPFNSPIWKMKFIIPVAMAPIHDFLISVMYHSARYSRSKVQSPFSFFPFYLTHIQSISSAHLGGGIISCISFSVTFLLFHRT